MAKGRADGEGSIFRRKSDGRWCAELYLGKDDAGKKIVWRCYGASQEDVRLELQKVTSDRNKGKPVTFERQTVSEYLDYWLKEVIRPSRRPNTYRGYEVNVRCHLKPAIGRHYLDKLTPQHVQRMTNDLLLQNLSPRTVQYVLANLSSALDQAVKWELVERNVVGLTYKPSVEAPEHRTFSADEAKRFLKAVKGDRLEALFVLTVSVGLRQAEALGLCWDSVDLDAGTIRITRQLTRVERKYQLSPLKSKSSRRLIPLPSYCAESLREHWVRQGSESQSVGWHNPDGLVFTTVAGRPINGTWLTHYYQDILRVNGLPIIDFHGLRHTCGTLLEAMGVPLSTIRDILGHASLTTTARFYVHGLAPLTKDAMGRMDGLLGEQD